MSKAPMMTEPLAASGFAKATVGTQAPFLIRLGANNLQLLLTQARSIRHPDFDLAIPGVVVDVWYQIRRQFVTDGYFGDVAVVPVLNDDRQLIALLGRIAIRADGWGDPEICDHVRSCTGTIYDGDLVHTAQLVRAYEGLAGGISIFVNLG